MKKIVVATMLAALSIPVYAGSELACLNYYPTGKWTGVDQWAAINIIQSSSRDLQVNDNNENPYFSHEMIGKSENLGCNSSKTTYDIKTIRTNKSDGCVTIMHGTVAFAADGTGRISTYGSDGTCDLPFDFKETIKIKQLF